MIDKTPALQALHNQYCTLTDRTLPFTSSHIFAWEAWASKFTSDDMSLVVRYLKHLIKLQRRRPESFRFHLFVQDTNRFAEDLSEAKAWNRGPVKCVARESVLKATGRPADTRFRPVRSAADVMAGELALKQLLDLRDSL